MQFMIACPRRALRRELVDRYLVWDAYVAGADTPMAVASSAAPADAALAEADAPNTSK
jgi:hypothetical protein